MDFRASTISTETFDKSLPASPSAPVPSALQIENSELRKRNRLLEEIIEVMYKQNLQYATILNKYKSFEKDSRRATENLAKLSKDMLAACRQHHVRMKTLEKEAKADWEDYCEEKPHDFGAVVDQYLEEMKERMVERECEEIPIGFAR